MELLRQLTPALVALQQQGDGVAHGVLTPDRIVVTPEGKLVIVEHVLGPAVESLDLSPARMRSELGLALPASDRADAERPRRRRAARLDCALAHPRPAGGRARLPHNMATLMDEFPRVAGRGSSSSPPLRMWLEQALQLGARTFGSAEAAYAALAGLPEDITPRPDPRRMLFFRPTEPPPFAAAGTANRASVASTR